MSSLCPVRTLATVGVLVVTGIASLATLAAADYSLREWDMTYDELERDLYDVYRRNGL